MHLVGFFGFFVRLEDGARFRQDDSEQVGLVADDNMLSIWTPHDVERPIRDLHCDFGLALPDIPDAQCLVFRDRGEAFRVERVPYKTHYAPSMTSERRGAALIVSPVRLPYPNGSVVAAPADLTLALEYPMRLHGGNLTRPSVFHHKTKLLPQELELCRR